MKESARQPCRALSFLSGYNYSLNERKQMKSKSNLSLTITIIFAFILTSCGSASNSKIATAVALTVEAQDTQSAPITETPLALATSLPLATIPTADAAASLPALTPPAAVSPAATSGTRCYANAAYVTDNPPDGTVVNPGGTFTHTWQIQNTGTCPWDSTWKFAYVSGDLMGAAVSYPLTYTAPNQTLNFSVVFTAPTVEGGHRGYWEIVSQWGTPVRDSGSGNPFWVDINVNSGTPGANTPTVYGVTSITYTYGTVNNPKIQQVIPGVNAGYCTGGANIFLTTFATIAASGPLKITFYFQHSDGPHDPPHNLTFTSASSQTVAADAWPIRISSNDGPYWEAIVVTSPVQTSFPNTQAVFNKNCL
jgi:hypothetical protein